MPPQVYEDREHAGSVLADALAREVAADLLEASTIIALPRGGVPVAAVVADRFQRPLDVLLVRKLGAPRRPELGIGAIGEDGPPLIDRESVRRLGVSDEHLTRIIERERRELVRRAARYRGSDPPPALAGTDVVVVDDGVATGVTTAAALGVLARMGATRLVLAVPVAAPSALHRLREQVDALVCPLRPEPLGAVGAWYEDFRQLSDEEVVAVLRTHERRPWGRRGVDVANPSTALAPDATPPIDGE